MKAKSLLLLPAVLTLSLLPPVAANAADASIDSARPIAVASWQAGRLDLFARGNDGTLKHKVFNGRWSSWQSLGGAITSGPAAVSRAAGHLDVFARGTAGDVQHRAYANGAWSAWTSVGGIIIDEPAVTSWSSDRMDLLVRGAGSNVVQKSWNNGTWTDWADLGGLTNAPPAAISWGANRLDVFVRGLDNALWQRYWAGSGWSDWSNLGGFLTSGPAVTSGGPGFISVYVRHAGNAIAERVFGYGWGAWTELNGTFVTAPAAEAWDGGHTDVFAFAPDGNLMQRTWIGFFGWTAWAKVPDSGPAVPVKPYTPTVAVQTAPAAGALVGGLAYAYVDNIGRIVSGFQADPANIGSIQWTVISGNEGFNGPPGLIEQADGRLQITGQHMSGDVWARAQTAKGASTWTDWINQGGTMAAAVTVVKQSDGSNVVLALDSSGGLWSMPQPSVSGPYRLWTSLGITGLSSLPAAVAGRDVLHLFAIAGGTMRTATLSLSGTASAWTSLGGAGLTGTPAAVVYPGYRMRVFARTTTGDVTTKAQDGALAWPAAWTQAGQAGVAAGAPAAVLSDLSGRVELVVRGAAGAILSSGETAQGSGLWRDWMPVLQGTDAAATDPTILSYNDGALRRWAFLFRTIDQQSRMYTVDTAVFSGLSTTSTGPSFTAGHLPGTP